MASLSGRVALVTGGARGLGRAVAEELLKRGAKVGICDLQEAAGQTAVKEMAATHGDNHVVFTRCDVTDPRSFEDTFKATKAAFGGLDIVVNNAGIGMEFTGWEKTIEVNVMGSIRGTQLGIENMRKDKGGQGGVIINMSSMAGVNPNPCGPVYAASKAAINHFSLSWVANPELAALMGVRINVVCPAFVETDLFKNLMDESTIHVPAVAQAILSRVGVMTPEYVAENVMTLIEDETKTGAVMQLSKTGGVQM